MPRGDSRQTTRILFVEVQTWTYSVTYKMASFLFSTREIQQIINGYPRCLHIYSYVALVVSDTL